MSGAEIVLIANIAVASMFAASYLIVALTNWSQRSALWFAATYMLGMVAPIAEFTVPFSSMPAFFEWLGYASFLAATLAMSASFATFHGRRPPWPTILVIFLGGMLTRIGIWDWTRDTLVYGFAYQLPLILAALLAARTTLRVDPRTAFHVALASVFAAIAVNLAVKPFLAAAFGSGPTLSAYTSTTYALLSQASSGVLLLAAGIVLILIVAQRAITASQHESETDALSGLANRRGFDRQAQELLARAALRGRPISVAVFDLDHFKRINDTYGHQTGDEVIAAFAALLRKGAPSSAILGRMGGEEFAMFVAGSKAPDMLGTAEAIRIEALRATREAIAATVSGGIAEHRPNETLAELLRRADQALYRAKSEGRDRVYLHADGAADYDISNVLPFFRGRTSG